MKHDNVAFEELAQLLQKLGVGTPLPVGDIHLVPLLLDASGPDAQLLHEAIDDGVAEVEELDHSGNVNMIRVRHAGTEPLLLLDGDEIVGAKQNRMFNASFIVEPGAIANIPVSCVERGRWGGGHRFTSSMATAVTSVRASKVTRVATSVVMGTGYDADQRAVWRDVDEYLCKTQIGSPTSAMADGTRARASAVEESLRAVTVAANQVGLAGVHSDRLLFLDVFASPAVYARAWKRIARSLLLDVYDPAQRGEHPAEAVATAIADVRTCALVGSPAPGGGTTICGNGKRNVITAIMRNEHAYHTVIAPL